MKKLESLSEKAVEERTKEVNVKKASHLIKKIFDERHLYLDKEELFEPTYFQCTLKERFYQNGGDELKVYDENQYAELLGVPASYILELAETTPEFILWLHEKRGADKEMDILVSIAARKMVNKMNMASSKDQAQIVNALSKFSTLVKPERKIDPFDELIENIDDLDVLKSELEKFGFTKQDEILLEAVSREEDEDDIQ